MAKLAPEPACGLRRRCIGSPCRHGCDEEVTGGVERQCHCSRPLHGGGVDPSPVAASERTRRCWCKDGERRTWAEEFEVACRVAQAARREGLDVGDRIAFLDRNGIAYFDFLFGGSLLGAVNVAVNWRLAPAEMAAIIDDSAHAGAGDPRRLPRDPERHAGRVAFGSSHRRDRRRCRRLPGCAGGAVRRVDRRHLARRPRARRWTPTR